MQTAKENHTGQACPLVLGTNTAPAKSTLADSEAALLQQIAADIERERTEQQRKLDSANGDFADRVRSLAQEQLERLANETPEKRLARRKAQGERRDRIQRDERNRGHREAWQALIKERGPRYETCRLTNYEITSPAQQKVVDALNGYANGIRERVNSGDGLLLIGPSGTGKDHLLIGMARIAIGADFKVRWASGPKLFARIRQAIDKDGETTDSVLRTFEQTQILILSDLLPPSGRLTEFQAETVYRLADERYNRLLPTWLAANVKDRAELENGLGVPVVDRLAHGATVLPCDWPSYRKRAK